eukprot:contig_33272_g8038
MMPTAKHPTPTPPRDSPPPAALAFLLGRPARRRRRITARCLLAVLLHQQRPRISALAAGDLRARPHGLAVHRARHAVVRLVVQLGQLVVVNDARVGQIAEGALVHNVAHREALDGLILGRLAAAAVTVDEAGVVPAMPVTAMVTALDRHGGDGGGATSCRWWSDTKGAVRQMVRDRDTTGRKTRLTTPNACIRSDPTSSSARACSTPGLAVFGPDRNFYKTARRTGGAE